jgi:hypothetical protein
LGLNNIDRDELERSVAFSSGIFLLFAVGITRLFELFQNVGGWQDWRKELLMM